MISRECGITAPLIGYHFGSKAKLGCDVFGDYCKRQANMMFKKAYEVGESNAGGGGSYESGAEAVQE